MQAKIPQSEDRRNSTSEHFWCSTRVLQGGNSIEGSEKDTRLAKWEDRETAQSHTQARRQARDQWMNLEGWIAQLGGSSRCMGTGSGNQLHRWEVQRWEASVRALTGTPRRRSRRITVEKVKHSCGSVFKRFTSVHRNEASQITQRQPVSPRRLFFSTKDIVFMYKQGSIPVPWSLHISSHPFTQVMAYTNN